MISLDELNTAWRDWNRSNKAERFGQYVLNRYTIVTVDTSFIFYESCPHRAYAYIALMINEFH